MGRGAYNIPDSIDWKEAMVVELAREALTRRRAGYAAEVQEEVYHNHHNAL